MGLHLLGDWDSPVIPIMVYHVGLLGAISRLLYKHHIAMVVVGFPATPLLLCRCRVCISASHSRADLDYALSAIEEVLVRRARIDYASRRGWGLGRAVRAARRWARGLGWEVGVGEEERGALLCEEMEVEKGVASVHTSSSSSSSSVIQVVEPGSQVCRESSSSGDSSSCSLCAGPGVDSSSSRCSTCSASTSPTSSRPDSRAGGWVE